MSSPNILRDLSLLTPNEIAAELNENVVVIYHNNCYDGVTAALVAYKKFGPAAQYLPFNYSDSPDLALLTNKDVYIIDFSFKKEVTRQIVEVAKSVTILDHHKTAEAELAEFQPEEQRYPTVLVIFDMNRSGAGIAWDFFFPEEERPDLVNYVEDRDLWRFALPNSKEYNAWFQSFPLYLSEWIEVVFPESLRDYTTIIEAGKSILRMQQSLTKQIVKHALVKQIFLPNPKVPSETVGFYCPYVQTAVLMSEVCEAMLLEFPDFEYVMYSFTRDDGKTQYGLRSKGEFDVSNLAKIMGGGGHKNAAGFEV